MPNIIEAKGIEMQYDAKTTALKDIDLEIKKGEWLTIMGPSGSGKTTLLNIIGCLDKPTNGNVVIKDIDITKLNLKELTTFRRENFGFIFQQFHLVPYLTALENVMLAQYFTLGKKTIEEKDSLEALVRVNLDDRIDHIPAHLSGGEQQRVSIARALVNKPPILLADEPTGNLDQKTGGIILKLLKSLHSEGHTVVLITHDMNIAKQGERIVRIVDGQIFDDNQNINV